MKKTTVILIAIIFVASIVVVNFFGMAYKTYDQFVVTEKIEVTADSFKFSTNIDSSKTTVKVGDDGTIKYVRFKYAGEGTAVIISPRVLPDNATNKNLIYSYDNSLEYVEKVTSESSVITVYFKGTGTVNLEIISAYDQAIRTQVLKLWAY